MKEFLQNYMGSYYNEMVDAQQSAFVNMIELVLAILVIIAVWKIFTKAGEPGWAALIPFYNIYKLFKISMGNGWFFLMLFLPLINFIAGILLSINLARAFGKSGGYAVGLILLTPVFLILLGFSDAQYLGPNGFGDIRPDENFQPRSVNFNDFDASPAENNAKTVDFEVINSDEEN